MTKRSAMTMAAGLATCLVVGVVAIMLMAGGVSIANAGAENKPLVRREMQTITVHRKAHSSGAGVVRVIHLSSSSTDPTFGSSSNENENETGTEKRTRTRTRASSRTGTMTLPRSTRATTSRAVGRRERPGMTERVPVPAPARRRRLSRRALRAWAWIAGGVALLAPLGALVAQPKIATASIAAPRRVIVKKIVRRIIVISPKATVPPARVVYVGGGSSSSGGSSVGSSSGGAAPAPVTTTGGSGVP